MLDFAVGLAESGNTIKPCIENNKKIAKKKNEDKILQYTVTIVSRIRFSVLTVVQSFL